MTERERERVRENILPQARSTEENFETLLFQAEVTVTVRITDANDNAPKFVDAPYTARVSEGADGEGVVLSVTAVDTDAGDNARLSFTLGEDNPEFQIDTVEQGNQTLVGSRCALFLRLGVAQS